MSNAKLGIGLATGMAFHAPAGTALPTYPTDIVGENGDGTSTDEFTATAAQSSFTLSESANAISSFTIDGVEADPEDVSVSGTTVTYSGTALDGGEKIAITYFVGAWRAIGDVTHDGISVTTDKSVNNIRNWANVIKRAIQTDHSETIQSPIMDTTAEVFKTVFGDDNVVTASSKTTVSLSDADLPDQEAYLWVMKDGDDMIAIGCSYGQITAVDNVAFTPGDAIRWTPTITAMGNDGFKLIME